MRLNSVPQKSIILAEEYSHLRGKKYFPRRLMKIKYQVHEIQVFGKLGFAEEKGICTQRAGNILKMHGKKPKKPP